MEGRPVGTNPSETPAKKGLVRLPTLIVSIPVTKPPDRSGCGLSMKSSNPTRAGTGAGRKRKTKDIEPYMLEVVNMAVALVPQALIRYTRRPLFFVLQQDMIPPSAKGQAVSATPVYAVSCCL